MSCYPQCAEWKITAALEFRACFSRTKESHSHRIVGIVLFLLFRDCGNAAPNTSVHFLFMWCTFSFLLGGHLAVELLSHTASLYRTFWEFSGIVSKVAAQCYIPSSHGWGLQCLHVFDNTYDYLSFLLEPSWRVKVSRCGFDLHFPDGYLGSCWIMLISYLYPDLLNQSIWLWGPGKQYFLKKLPRYFSGGSDLKIHWVLYSLATSRVTSPTEDT